MAKRINVSLIAGEDGCSIEGGIRLVKLAYSYEQWEVFDALIENILTYIRVSSQYCWICWYVKGDTCTVYYWICWTVRDFLLCCRS